MFNQKTVYLTNIYKCSRGAAALEFAIIAGVFLTFLVGFIELSLIFFTNMVLESATGYGSRIGRTGYSDDGIPRVEFIKSEVERLSGGFLNPDLLEIEILSYSGFDKIGQPEPCIPPTDPYPCPGAFDDINGDGVWSADQGVSDSAGGGRAVAVYRVTYPWHVFTPLMSTLIADEGGNVNISAIATVRNEPF